MPAGPREPVRHPEVLGPLAAVIAADPDSPEASAAALLAHVVLAGDGRTRVEYEALCSIARSEAQSAGVPIPDGWTEAAAEVAAGLE